MALFVGEFDVLIDSKHRLAIPAALREQIVPEEDGKNMFLVLGPDRHLWLYPDLYYRKLVARLRRSPLPSRQTRRIDLLFAMARMVKPDAQGRVVLPEKSMQRAVVSDSVTLAVTNRPPHVTRVTWSPRQPDDTEQVTFSGVGDDPDGDIARWFWTFCGQTIAGGSTAAYTFPTDGVFTVSLTVEDDDGQRSDPHLVEVSIANAPPVARIALSRLDGRTIAFDAQDSYDPSPDGQIVHVAWDFGDGTTCPGTPSACGNGDRMAPVHFYSEPGTYIVTLVVVDEQGALSFAEQSIKIFE